MTFTPIANRVLVRRATDNEKTEGGLFFPERAQERSLEAVVVAVGPGGYTKAGVLVPVPLKAGDRVLITKWAGDIIELDGVSHTVVKDYAEVLGVLEPDDTPAMLHQGESVLEASA